MKRPVPRWLLDELFLDEGEFNDDETIVIGRPNNHLSAVLNVGHGTPSRTECKLTAAQIERLKKQ
jgi:hypothetical protein